MVERWVFWAPLVVMVLYQYELVFGRDEMNGLKSFILTAPRSPDDDDNDNDDASFSFASVFSAPFFVFLNHTIRTLWRRFFFANREGILGCLGYSFLHAAGEWVGQHYVFGSSDNSSSSSSSSLSIWPLGKLTVCAWMALYSLNLVFNLTVSRREMNLSFCLWAIAHNLTILFGFKVMTAVLTQTQMQMQSNSSSSSSNKTTNNNSDNNININNSETETDIDINNEPTIDIVPLAFGAVNRHGMVSFLVANLLTGLVNLLVPTIDQGDGVAMAILVAYLFAVGGVALLLDHSSSSKRKRKNKSIERYDEPTLATKKIN